MAERVGFEPTEPKKFPLILINLNRLCCQQVNRAGDAELRFCHQRWEICLLGFYSMS